MIGIRSWTATCGDDMPTFVAVPDHMRKAPAVIVVHKRYGFVCHTRDLAERFARDGFVAVAPDLYFKHPDQEAVHRGDAICDVADPDALVAIGATIDALKTIPQADPARLAIMGVCQTGRVPLVVAASRPISRRWSGAARRCHVGIGAADGLPASQILRWVNDEMSSITLSLGCGAQACIHLPTVSCATTRNGQSVTTRVGWRRSRCVLEPYFWPFLSPEFSRLPH
jgi:hypothetical protein